LAATPVATSSRDLTFISLWGGVAVWFKRLRA
jgi:hypothetical protein